MLIKFLLMMNNRTVLVDSVDINKLEKCPLYNEIEKAYELFTKKDYFLDKPKNKKITKELANKITTLYPNAFSTFVSENYKKDNINKAIESGNEIMLVSDKVYAIKEEFVNEIT